MIKDISIIPSKTPGFVDDDLLDDLVKALKYTRIIKLLAEKQQIPLDEAMNMLYTSPLFEIIDDGTADLICRSDIYLANEIIRMHND